MVWALIHFKEIILGYDIHFLTDYRPFKYILTDSNNFKGRQIIWVDKLLESNLKIDFAPSSARKIAEALSRNVSVNSFSVLSPSEFHVKQHDDLQRLQSSTT